MTNTNFYDAMNEVLATRRYDRLTGRRADISEMISQWLNDVLSRFFSRFNFTVEFGELNYNLDAISIAFVAIGAALVIAAAVVLYRTFRGRSRIQHHDLSEIFEELAKKNYTVTELINLSDSADTRRLAIRYRYIASLLALNEKQITEIKPSATNGLILRQIKETCPALSQPFGHTADVFHKAWFGYKDINDSTYENFADSVQSIISGDFLCVN
ncbi:MAG: hypothetical protein FWC32_06640 [Firmicutes bacterium]|nr:hypothetical protein [Bacillota bacterium]